MEGRGGCYTISITSSFSPGTAKQNNNNNSPDTFYSLPPEHSNYLFQGDTPILPRQHISVFKLLAQTGVPLLPLTHGADEGEAEEEEPFVHFNGTRYTRRSPFIHLKVNKHPFLLFI